MAWKHTGEWRYSSTILDLCTRWMWVVSFTALPFYPQGKSTRYPLDSRPGGPQSRSSVGIATGWIPVSARSPGTEWAPVLVWTLWRREKYLPCSKLESQSPYRVARRQLVYWVCPGYKYERGRVVSTANELISIDMKSENIRYRYIFSSSLYPYLGLKILELCPLEMFRGGQSCMNSHNICVRVDTAIVV
jgi:hypothetical protein